MHGCNISKLLPAALAVMQYCNPVQSTAYTCLWTGAWPLQVNIRSHNPGIATLLFSCWMHANNSKHQSCMPWTDLRNQVDSEMSTVHKSWYTPNAEWMHKAINIGCATKTANEDIITYKAEFCLFCFQYAMSLCNVPKTFVPQQQKKMHIEAQCCNQASGL